MTTTTLTHKERWLRTLRFEPVDHVPDEEFGYWDETFPAWHAQGLPAEIASIPQADAFFGFAPVAYLPFNSGLQPPFERQELASHDGRRRIRDEDGVTCELFASGDSTIPHYVDFPIKDRASWREFSKRLDPAAPGRLPANLDTMAANLNRSDCPVIVMAGSLLGVLRNWAGFEGLCMLCYDDPALVEEMIESRVEMALAHLDTLLGAVRCDAAIFWEDIAFNSGPMISPEMFARWLVPGYQRITDKLHSYGIEFVIVDCDGNINELVPGFLAGGVNVMFPLEIAGDSDPVQLRAKFGRELLLKGGVDKRALIRGPRAIDAELQRLLPLVEEGGFIPHVDHRVPPDVSYADYQYYLERKRTLYGIPMPPG